MGGLRSFVDRIEFAIQLGVTKNLGRRKNGYSDLPEKRRKSLMTPVHSGLASDEMAQAHEKSGSSFSVISPTFLAA